MINRRQFLAASGLGTLSSLNIPGMAFSDVPSHGMSVFGPLKYRPDFSHFDYVNPDAPKGGRISTPPNTSLLRTAAGSNQSFRTFDSFNMMILKGNTPALMDMIFDTLMTRAHDEPDAIYGLLARTVKKIDNGDGFLFHLRENARFHDGSPLTAEDCAFSLHQLKEKGHPLISQPLKEMLSATDEAPHLLRVKFSGKQTRSLPLLVAQLPIMSKKYYESHDFTKTTLKPPLTSGPYKIGRFTKGQFVEFERVKDYWGADLPVNKGQFNFDTTRIEFFRERFQSFEAFKAGDYNLREEFTSRYWAKNYDFPAIKDGRVKQQTLKDETPSGAQGWFLNTRRSHLKDARVREAIGLLFDFEWSNRNLFFGAYNRTYSYFQNSEMEAQNLPGPLELALLEPYRQNLPEAVFQNAYQPPVSDGSGRDRRLFRKAAKLLQSAGWARTNGLFRDQAGRPLPLEFLDYNTSFEHVLGPYVENLRQIGIDAKIRIVDPTQYQLRVKNFDYDLISSRFSMALTPGEGLRQIWGSQAAGRSGSNNFSGIKDPVVDALIEKVISAPTRQAMTFSARALDRVLRAGHYWVPHWNKAAHTVAYWDIFGQPTIKPAYDRGILSTWWYDAKKAESIGLSDID